MRQHTKEKPSKVGLMNLEQEGRFIILYGAFIKRNWGLWLNPAGILYLQKERRDLQLAACSDEQFKRKLKEIEDGIMEDAQCSGE